MSETHEAGADSGAGAGAADKGEAQGGTGANEAGQSEGGRLAEIAARAGGAFAGRTKAGNGKNGSDDAGDGIDPASRPPPDWPAWLPQKFRGKDKGQVNTQALAEAYTTLESNHTSLKAEKGWGKAGEKPDDYVRELKVPEDAKLDRIRAIDVATDPAVGVYRKIAHKHKIPVDVASGFMLDFLTEINPMLPSPASEDDILAELGEGAAAKRDTLKTWLDGQITSKNFADDEIEFFYNQFGGSAVGLRALSKLRELMGEPPIPVNPGKLADGVPSKEEWYALNTDDRMASDPGFRAKVEAWGDQLFGTEPAGTSEPGLGMPPPRKVERRERAATRR